MRVVGVVTKKPLGISLAPPTKEVGGLINIEMHCKLFCIFKHTRRNQGNNVSMKTPFTKNNMND